MPNTTAWRATDGQKARKQRRDTSECVEYVMPNPRPRDWPPDWPIAAKRHGVKIKYEPKAEVSTAEAAMGKPAVSGPIRRTMTVGELSQLMKEEGRRRLQKAEAAAEAARSGEIVAEESAVEEGALPGAPVTPRKDDEARVRQAEGAESQSGTSSPDRTRWTSSFSSSDGEGSQVEGEEAQEPRSKRRSMSIDEPKNVDIRARSSVREGGSGFETGSPLLSSFAKSGCFETPGLRSSWRKSVGPATAIASS